MTKTATIETTIHKDMLIGDAIAQYPELIDALLAEGVHCVGCGAAYHETIEQGLSGHGKSEEEVTKILETLNKVVTEEQKNILGDETIKISRKAVERVIEFMKEHDKEGCALRIEVMEGGCSGHQYGFDFEKESKEGDTIIKAGDIEIFLDKESLAFLKGSRIDYVDSLMGGGFKISNPNVHRSCGCGQSFS